MGRAANVPDELTKGPFTLAEARRVGVDRWHLEGATWKRLAPGVYAWVGLEDSPAIHVAAAQLRLPSTAVFSGPTAAWIHRLTTDPGDPIEVTVAPGIGVSLRTGLCVRRASLPKHEIAVVRGMRATTVERTLVDLSATCDVTEAVVLADTAAHLRLTNVKKLRETAARSSGRPGISTFRRVIDFVEPATESQMESRLRMLIILKGIPRPVVQKSLYDRFGRFLGRPDLYYPEAKLGLEYDGEIHKTSLPEDNRRQNRLLAAGIRLLRFTAVDIYKHPDRVVEQIRVTLAA